MRYKNDPHDATTEPRLLEREVSEPSNLEADAKAKFVVQILPGGGMILHYPTSPSDEAGAPVAARAFEHTMVPGPVELQ